MNSQKVWKVRLDNRVFEASSEEIIIGIKKGKILPQDEINNGGTSWTIAGNIPEFAKVFDELDVQASLKRTKKFEGKDIFTNFQIKVEKLDEKQKDNETKKCCSIHPDLPPYYICTICENLFCKNCPVSKGSNLKVCPYCGGLCTLYMAQQWKFEPERHNGKYSEAEKENGEKAKKYIEPVNVKLVLEDFLAALMYPFYFPISLIIGGILFSTLVFGQLVTAFSGGWMILAAIVLFCLLLMLKFSVFAKTLENLTQGNFQNNFMPRMKKFTIWEDTVNPFIMSLSVYSVSFGLFFLVMAISGLYSYATFTERLENIKTEMQKSGNQLNSTIDSTKSIQDFSQQEKAEAADKQTNPGKSQPNERIKKLEDNELRAMINQAHLRQIESVFGQNHLLDNKELEKFTKSIMGMTLIFQIPIYLALIFGILYFPAVCLTVSKNRSFSALLNFKEGFTEIREVGFDYIKILLLCFAFFVIIGSSVFGLYALFSKLNIPLAAILTSLVAGSFLTFYFWIVFSGILGITVYKRT